MKLLRVVEGKINKYEYGKWAIFAKDLFVEVIDHSTENKREGIFKTVKIPARDPYILVHITNQEINKEYASFRFSPEKWESLARQSKTERVEIGIQVTSGVKRYFFLEVGGSCTINQISAAESHVQVEIWDKKTRNWQGKYSPDEWKSIELSSFSIPVTIGMASTSTNDNYYYLFKSSFYASEISMTGSDVLTVLESSEEIKKEKLSKELERVKAHSEFSGINRKPVPEDIQVLVWNRDHGKCVKCGSAGNLEFDHIIPVSKGGSNTARNFQLLCEQCNRSKRDNIGG